MAQQDRRRHGVYPSAEFVTMPPEKYTFRYFSENRHHGTIKIKIRVNDYEGPVKAVLACVTEEEDLPHPNMVMCPKQHGCPDAVCTIQTNITEKKNEIVFSQIGILRVRSTKREELEEAMRIRTCNTDFPFVRGYDGGSRDLRTINLTRLRFACQVLIPDAASALRHPLAPVVTTRVTHYPEDKLKIIDASHDCGAATGGLPVLLFTAKLPKSVEVVFRERDSDWRAQAAAVKQHQKVALKFTTPPYQDPYCLLNPVKVFLLFLFFMAQTMDNDDEQLADEENRREFTYLPITDKYVLEEIIRQKDVSPTFMNIFNEVETGDRAGAAPETHQREVGLIRIPSWELYGGAIPQDLYQNPAEHDIPEPWRDNNPLPPEILEFLNEFETQAMEVDTTARSNLEQSLFIERSLLEPLMEVDVPGYEDLPG